VGKDGSLAFMRAASVGLGGLLAALCSLGPASAATVTAGSLINLTEARQLEDWLGVGPQDFTRIWTGVAGVARSAEFHAAADGVGPTVSVFHILLADGSDALIGGYTAQDWGGNGYMTDAAAFLFDLTTSERQLAKTHPEYAIWSDPRSFPTFGAGPDLVAGEDILGQCGTALTVECDGRSYSYSFEPDQGQIAVPGDQGTADGNSGLSYASWSVQSLDVYSFAPMAAVPLPGGMPLMAGGIAALVALRRRGLAGGTVRG
jgi:hypothetical protein